MIISPQVDILLTNSNYIKRQNSSRIRYNNRCDLTVANHLDDVLQLKESRLAASVTGLKNWKASD